MTFINTNVKFWLVLFGLLIAVFFPVLFTCCREKQTFPSNSGYLKKPLTSKLKGKIDPRVKDNTLGFQVCKTDCRKLGGRVLSPLVSSVRCTKYRIRMGQTETVGKISHIFSFRIWSVNFGVL